MICSDKRAPQGGNGAFCTEQQLRANFDRDYDGLPDSWEGAKDIDPFHDDDGDGYTNLEEYLLSLSVEIRQ